LIEHEPGVPPADYDESNRALVAYNDQPGTLGRFELVTIRGGKQALVTTSEDGSRSSVFWLEGDIEIVVRGSEMNRGQAIHVANTV
jgi:hypothetical protein